MPNHELLAAIDLQISRLTQARALLTEDDVPAMRRLSGAGPVEITRANRPVRPKRELSADARKRIADAQKRRWAAQKGSE